MPLVDRDAVLAATDLEALATDLCGPPRGHGRSARWHCPNPAHPDEHPSMGVYTTPSGGRRWKCHACGDGGTAVDLLVTATGTTVREALLTLARTAGLDPPDHPPTRPARPRARPTTSVPAAREDAPDTSPEPSPAVEEFVAACTRLLWTPAAAGPLRYLHDRGFDDDLLAANRVGFDPGPRHLPRLDGLPGRGPAVVFPVLHPDQRHAVYYQLRYLSPRTRRRYDQPTSQLAPNPKLAFLTTAGPPRPGVVAVCEGFPDALTAASTGITSVAVLGTGHTSTTSTAGADHLARRVLDRHPDTVVLVCFDDDTATRPGKTPAGQNAANHLGAALADHGAPVVNLQPPPGVKDLNAWHQTDPTAVHHHLHASAGVLGTELAPLNLTADT